MIGDVAQMLIDMAGIHTACFDATRSVINPQFQPCPRKLDYGVNDDHIKSRLEGVVLMTHDNRPWRLIRHAHGLNGCA